MAGQESPLTFVRQPFCRAKSGSSIMSSASEVPVPGVPGTRIRLANGVLEVSMIWYLGTAAPAFVGVPPVHFRTTSLTSSVIPSERTITGRSVRWHWNCPCARQIAGNAHAIIRPICRPLRNINRFMFRSWLLQSERLPPAPVRNTGEGQVCSKRSCTEGVAYGNSRRLLRVESRIVYVQKSNKEPILRDLISGAEIEVVVDTGAGQFRVVWPILALNQRIQREVGRRILSEGLGTGAAGHNILESLR